MNGLPFTKTLLLISLVLMSSAHAARIGRIIDDIQLSRTGTVATAEMIPGCRMRYLDQSPSTGGRKLWISLLLDHECKNAIGGAANELYRPTGRALAEIDEVEFDTVGNGRATITITFDRPVKFDVSQRATGGLSVRIDTGGDDIPDEQLTETPATGSDLAEKAPSANRPLRLKSQTDKGERFAVLLGVFRDATQAASSIPSSYSQLKAYAVEMDVGGQSWQGLHLGFFESESQAEATIRDLKSLYPDAWIVVVSDDDHRKAMASKLKQSDQPRSPPSVAPRPDAQLPEQQLPRMMTEAKQSIVKKQYPKAIELYTEVLQVRNHPHRRQAREFLGLAFERNGQFDHAKAEYEQYLIDYPDDADATRVQGRLDAVVTVDIPSQPAFTNVDEVPAAEPVWDAYGGVAQYYVYNIEEIPTDQGQVARTSGINTYGDFLVRRRGERLDVTGRVNSAYLYDTEGEDDGFGSGNRGSVSHAYLDIVDNKTRLSGRLGRQTRTGSGLLGRFDGLHVGYQWKPRLSLNLVAGHPVESPRYEYNTRRFFYGASVDFENIGDHWDLSLFTHQQTVDGINDRQAVGTEAHFSSDRWNLVSLIDYDASYEVLNTALLSAHLRVGDETTINALLDFGAQPYLTTQNALAGQLVRTVDELLQTYTEGQIRTLARDRTAQAYRASLGLSRPLSSRLRLNADVTFTEIDATIASGGVAEIPATGAQLFYTMTLTRTGLITRGDLTLITLRHDTTRTFNSSTLTLDARYPIGDGFRFNPRVSVTQRDNRLDGSDQIIATPSLRLLYRWARRFLIEFEGGVRWSNRELAIADPFFPDEKEEILGNFINFGYRAEF